MEQIKNNRLNELFNQAKKEPSKISFDEVKEQFVKSTGALNASTGGKLAQFYNLKTIIMLSTILSTTIGAVILITNFSEPEKSNTISNINEEVKHNKEIIARSESLTEKEHKKVVQSHFKKTESLAPSLKEAASIKDKIALKVKDLPKDSTKKQINDLKVSKRNNEILDSNYRFPNLGYVEISANNRQKNKMFGKVRKQKNNRKKKAEGVNGRNTWNPLDPKGFLFIPMGDYNRNGEIYSIQSFYMKQTEVSNLEYRTFLFDLLIQGRKLAFLKAKPNQQLWLKELPNGFNKSLTENYFSHPAYDDYPAVGMSRIGAEMYCKWFTDELHRVSGNNVNNVRLPSSFEWEYAAKDGASKNIYPWGLPNVTNSEGCFLANFKPGEASWSTGCGQDLKIYNEMIKDNGDKSPYLKNPYSADGGYYTVKTNSYNPNNYGLYCMSGNVAEMVYYEGENIIIGTRGGSWASIGQELQIVEGKDRFKGFVNPSSEIGFRPVISYLGGAVNVESPITITPPGTKKIDNNLFFDETEVTNAMWKEYLSWLKIKHGQASKEYKTALPDTTVWVNNGVKLNEPYKIHYFSHPAYLNYPLVGVSYEQALEFCNWRTERVKEYFDILKAKNTKEIYPTNFEYRLPTKVEWERVANSNYSEKTLKKLETKYKGQTRNNLKRGAGNRRGEGILNDNADITAPVKSYWPNKYGVYNTTGNVAEMIIEKGIAKGGAWIHPIKEVSVEREYDYKKPTKWLGFRCVFEIK